MILFVILQRGLTVADLEYIDVPMIWDYLTTYHSLTEEEQDDTQTLRNANLCCIKEMYEAGEISEEDYMAYAAN